MSILSPTLRSVVISEVEEGFSQPEHIPAVWALMDVLGDAVAFPRSEKFSLDVDQFPSQPLRALSRMANLRQLSILG